MKIPASFKLGHTTYRVESQPSIPYGYKGRFYPDWKIVIALRNGYPPYTPRTPKTISETFWHEAVHAILYEMGHELWDNEKFVIEFSRKLNQLVWTAKLS
jgi:hypothetical protein